MTDRETLLLERLAQTLDVLPEQITPEFLNRLERQMCLDPFSILNMDRARTDEELAVYKTRCRNYALESVND